VLAGQATQGTVKRVGSLSFPARPEAATKYPPLVRAARFQRSAFSNQAHSPKYLQALDLSFVMSKTSSQKTKKSRIKNLCVKIDGKYPPGPP
jgi:hypothetical protein